MKKTLCFLLAGLLVLCLSACGSGDSSPAADAGLSPVESSPQIVNEEVPSIGGHPSGE